MLIQCRRAKHTMCGGERSITVQAGGGNWETALRGGRRKTEEEQQPLDNLVWLSLGHVLWLLTFPSCLQSRGSQPGAIWLWVCGQKTGQRQRISFAFLDFLPWHAWPCPPRIYTSDSTKYDTNIDGREAYARQSCRPSLVSWSRRSAGTRLYWKGTRHAAVSCRPSTRSMQRYQQQLRFVSRH